MRSTQPLTVCKLPLKRKPFHFPLAVFVVIVIIAALHNPIVILTSWLSGYSGISRIIAGQLIVGLQTKGSEQRTTVTSIPETALHSKENIFGHATHLLRGIDGHFDAIAQLFARLSHALRNVGRRERVRIDVDVQAGVCVHLGAARLIDDAQVERIHGEAGQARPDLVHVQLIQDAGARQYRGTAPMGESQLLARENARRLRVIGREHRERGVTGHAQREADPHLGRHIGVEHGEAARVLVLVLQRGQAEGKVLRELLDKVFARLFAAHKLVHDTGGGGRCLLNRIPDAQKLKFL